MARGSQRNIHTRYHVMEAAGVFDSNPANSYARDEDGNSLYKGPVEFPKMLYHPQGEEKVIVPGELILTPGGREVLVGEQRELVHRIVGDREEEVLALADGWHTTPRAAIIAGNEVRQAAGEKLRLVPAASPAQVISDKDAEIRRLQEQIASMEKGRGKKLAAEAAAAAATE